MTPFPVIDSTLSPRHLALWLAEKYPLGPGTTCRLFRTNMNHTYIVTAEQKRYVLRVYSYNRRSLTQIAEELRIVHLLKEAGIHVSYPIPDTTNQYIQQIQAPEGIRYAVLFSFAEGNKIRNLTEELCKGIGYQMAHIHQTLRNQKINRIDYAAHNLFELAHQQASMYFSELLDDMQFIKAAAKVWDSVAAKAMLQRYGVVHLDIWYDNMSIAGSGQITLFDFDNCGNGWLILDIGYFCMQLFYTQPDKLQYQKKLQSFLNGYRKAASISREEESLIPYAGLAVWVYYLGVQAERFDNFSNIFFTENYLKMYMGKAKEWLLHHQIEINP